MSKISKPKLFLGRVIISIIKNRTVYAETIELDGQI